MFDYYNRYISMHTVNLKYYANNLIEKKRVVFYIAGTLKLKGYSLNQISYWLGVPAKMLKDCVKKYHDYDQLVKMGWFKRTIEANIRWFEKHQKPVDVPQQDVDSVWNLLSLPISTSQIARGALVKQPIISYLRTGKRDISRLSPSTLRRLLYFYISIRSWASLRTLRKVETVCSHKDYAFEKTLVASNIKRLEQDHDISTDFAKKLMKDHNYRWLVISADDVINGHRFSIGIDCSKRNHVISDGSVDDRLMAVARRYAHIPTNQRYAAGSDSSYTTHLLHRKCQKIEELEKQLFPAEDITTKLHLNPDFVRQFQLGSVII